MRKEAADASFERGLRERERGHSTREERERAAELLARDAARHEHLAEEAEHRAADRRRRHSALAGLERWVEIDGRLPAQARREWLLPLGDAVLQLREARDRAERDARRASGRAKLLAESAARMELLAKAEEAG